MNYSSRIERAVVSATVHSSFMMSFFVIYKNSVIFTIIYRKYNAQAK